MKTPHFLSFGHLITPSLTTHHLTTFLLRKPTLRFHKILCVCMYVCTCVCIVQFISERVSQRSETYVRTLANQWGSSVILVSFGSFHAWGWLLANARL